MSLVSALQKSSGRCRLVCAIRCNPTALRYTSCSCVLRNLDRTFTVRCALRSPISLATLCTRWTDGPRAIGTEVRVNREPEKNRHVFSFLS